MNKQMNERIRQKSTVILVMKKQGKTDYNYCTTQLSIDTIYKRNKKKVINRKRNEEIKKMNERVNE